MLPNLQKIDLAPPFPSLLLFSRRFSLHVPDKQLKQVERNQQFNISLQELAKTRCKFNFLLPRAFRVFHIALFRFFHSVFFSFYYSSYYLEDIGLAMCLEGLVVPSPLFAQILSMTSAFVVFRSYAHPIQAMKSIKAVVGLRRYMPSSAAL